MSSFVRYLVCVRVWLFGCVSVRNCACAYVLLCVSWLYGWLFGWLVECVFVCLMGCDAAVCFVMLLRSA